MCLKGLWHKVAAHCEKFPITLQQRFNAIPCCGNVTRHKSIRQLQLTTTTPLKSRKLIVRFTAFLYAVGNDKIEPMLKMFVSDE